MARKPKTQPSPDDAAAAPVPEPATPDEAAVPARRGRKPKAAAFSSASPSMTDVGSPATGDAGADIPKADPIKTPGHRGPGRKPKQAVSGKAAPSIQDGAAEPQGQASGQTEAEADPDLSEDDVPMAAAVFQAGTAAGRDPVNAASEAAQSVPEAGASVSARPAAHWDRTTDRVQFDWPTIERVAAQGGPNQAMAKLLVAARAEGTSSRWPF